MATCNVHGGMVRWLSPAEHSALIANAKPGDQLPFLRQGRRGMDTLAWYTVRAGVELPRWRVWVALAI